MESREIKKSYTSNNEIKVLFALFLVKGKRLVKVNYLDCDAIRMLHQIFSEILNALNISVQEGKCNLQWTCTVFSKEK